MPATPDEKRAAVAALLRAELEGCHGESERRAAAEFVRDALAGGPDEDPVAAAADLAESLADAATALARAVRNLPVAGPLLFAAAADTIRWYDLDGWWAERMAADADPDLWAGFLEELAATGRATDPEDGVGYVVGDRGALLAAARALVSRLGHARECARREHPAAECTCFKADVAGWADDG